jgi:hypothetical protein
MLGRRLQLEALSELATNRGSTKAAAPRADHLTNSLLLSETPGFIRSVIRFLHFILLAAP